MNIWQKIKQRIGIVTVNDRLDLTNDRLSDISDELTRLLKKVRKAPQTYGQIERQRSEYRHPSRHH